MPTYSWYFMVDLDPPILNIIVDDPASFDINITIAADEGLTIATMIVEDPLSNNLTLTLQNQTLLPSLSWVSELYTIYVNGSYTVYVSGTDQVGNVGFNSTTFTGVALDNVIPNITAAYTDPAGLLYNSSGPFPNWATYPESAGVEVNITAEFTEMLNFAVPITGVWLNYSTNGGGSWTTLNMTYNGTTNTVGNYNISYYTVTMPMFRNGTVVLINIRAMDNRNNTLDLQTNMTDLLTRLGWYVDEYTVIGNWLETFDVTLDSLQPLTPFNVTAVASLRNSSYAVQVTAYLYNPDLEPLAGDFFSPWTALSAPMNWLGGFDYDLTWPYPNNLTHNNYLYVALQIINPLQNIVLFQWNGSYSMTHTTTTLSSAGTALPSPVLSTTNMTMGYINDTIAPQLTGPLEDAIQLLFAGDEITDGDDVEFRIRIEDRTGIKRITIIYNANPSAGAGSALAAKANSTVDALYYYGVFIAIVPKQGAGSIVNWWIETEDFLGNTEVIATGSYTVAPVDYSLYIFLITLFGVILISSVIVRRRKKAAVADMKGPERYKRIKRKI